MQRPRTVLNPLNRQTTAGAVMALVGALAAMPAQAQDDIDATASAPTVQQLPNNDTMNLNAALTRLGQNPRDVAALADAGQAALAIGDVDAAIGFFTRADQVMPGNPRAKAGLARALVRNGNPFDAIPQFEEAARAGPLDSATMLDRGLAYDLVADNASAQRTYRQVLATGANDEATRRLAISLAISGDKRGSGTTIAPLLTRQDKAAWRARAFSLAILGQPDEAVAIVNSTLPTQLASGISPYLRYMPRLTAAQQAAAANFGQFPRAAEIGQDDPRVARFATTTRRGALASADSSLVPRGEPLGRGKHSREERDAAREAARLAKANPAREAPPQVALATPEPRTTRVFDSSAFPAYVAPSQSAPLTPAPSRSTTTMYMPPAPASTPPPPSLPAYVRPTVVATPPPVARPLLTPPAPTPQVRPSLTLTQPPPEPTARPIISSPAAAPAAIARAPAQVTPAAPTVAAMRPSAVAMAAHDTAFAAQVSSSPALTPPPAAKSAPTPAGPPVAPVPRRQSLSEAFSDLARPSVDIAPASGAVDLRRIRPAREVAPGQAEAPAPPSHPSRIWVQLGIGRDKAALAFDWRRMTRQAEAVFKGKHGSTSNWGQTNRLLVGPFESEAAANVFLGQLRRADIDGAFVWTSPAGQVVDALPGK